MRSRFGFVAAFSAALLLSVQATAQERVVNFYNWSNYMAPDVLEAFTKETGIKVVYDTFDANETLETRLLAGKSGYDVVVPTAYFLQRQITAHVFQKLDKSKLPNLANAWPTVTQRLATYDPGNLYAANYMWGTTGIGYNVKTVQKILGPDAKIDSWDIVLKPENLAKFKDCGVHMLDSADDIFPAALSYLELDPEFHQAGRSRKGRRPDHEGSTLCAQVSFVGISERARNRRNLPCGGLVRRRHAGAQPRGRSQEQYRDRLRHSERGRADVFRQSRDPRRRAARGRSL